MKLHGLFGFGLIALVFLTVPKIGWTADCCKCTAPDKPNQNICITSQPNTDCSTIPQKTSNPLAKTLTCQTIANEAQCKSIASGGICSQGPLSDLNYGKQAEVQPQNIPDPKGTPPTLGVPIPGLRFSETLSVGGGYLSIPYLAQYISAVYQFVVGLAVVAAAVALVYGGFLYLTGSVVSDIKKGKTVIINACIGLVLVLGAYTILATVNPATINLTALRIKPIVTQDFQIISSLGAGFKDGKASEENEKLAAQAAILGRGPLIDPTKGEAINIASIPVTGKTFSERLNSYCTPDGDRDKLDTYDKKAAALARVVLGFKKICIDEKGCSYVRGGFTDLRTGKVMAGAADIPFLEKFIKSYKPDINLEDVWGKECQAQWNGSTSGGGQGTVSGTIGLKDGFYEGRSTATYADFEYSGTKKCYGPLQQKYAEILTKPMTEQGIFGGDCGTTLVQMYKCAGGTVARPGSAGSWSIQRYTQGPLGLANGSFDRPDGKDIIVWAAKNLEDMDAQIKEAGGLRFGDIVLLGNGGSQHNFMYTGGRADVPFDIFEMGGGGAQDGTVGAAVHIKGLGVVGGMKSHPAPPGKDNFYNYVENFGRRDFSGNIIAGLKSKAYPVYIVRPYDFEPCSSKSQCKTGQACHCTAGDKHPAWSLNKCSNAFICHSVNTSYCQNDEHCPVGQSCIKKTPTSPTGSCG